MKKELITIAFILILATSFVIAEPNQIQQATTDKIQSEKSAISAQTQNRTLTQEQIKKIIKVKNRIRVRINLSDCPNNCTCTGSTTKCEFEGGRTMTVNAGNSGNTIIQVKNANMSTKVTLYKTNNSLYGVFKGNKTKEIILPDKIQEKIRERIKAKIHNQTIELDENGIYQVQTKKRARLFFLIPVKEKVSAEVNAETGEIIKIRNPWWGFLARDIKE